MRRVPIAIAVAIALMAFMGGALYAGANGGKSFSDPDAGKSRAQVDAEQQAASDDFWRRFPIWIREQRTKISDPSSLPRAEILASVAAPPQTIAAATSLASVIARGKVSTVAFQDTGDTLVSIDVTDELAGVAHDQLDVLFVGGLRPVPDWDHVVLGFVAAAPIPNVGDDLVLFLTRSPTQNGAFEPQPFTGIYWVDSSGLRPVEGNPLAQLIEGKSVADLKMILSALPTAK
jgi:hypothetical protein